MSCAEGLPAEVTEELLEDDDFLQKFHHALLQVSCAAILGLLRGLLQRLLQGLLQRLLQGLLQRLLQGCFRRNCYAKSAVTLL
jgi:hypothetical protein